MLQPAITPDGSRFWFTANRGLHRIDGPAIEHANGNVDWWLRDKKLSLTEYLAQNTDMTDEEKVMMKLTYG